MIETIKNFVLETFFGDLILVKQENEVLRDKISVLHSLTNDLAESKKLTKKELLEVQEMVKQLSAVELSEIDAFLSNNYQEVPKFAYQNKRRYNGVEYAVTPNQMIQPDDWFIQQLHKELRNLPERKDQWALEIGRNVDRRITWVSDKDTTGMDDFYHLVAETLISKRGDCESQCFVVASLFPDLFGIAFGNTQKNNKGTWHAWNIFVHNNELWVLETNSIANFPNGGNTWVRKAKDSDYTMDWIFTKNKTFRARGSTHFGHIAR